MKKLIELIAASFKYVAGEDCPQCDKGRLRDTGQVRHGDRVLKCSNGICGWEVRENT